MESPSEPVAVEKMVNQPSSNAGGKSRRARASERSKNTVKSGTVTFREHALTTISIDAKSRIITLPAPMSFWEPITAVSWRDLDMCIRYVIKFANGGGAADLSRMSKSKPVATEPPSGSSEPSKSDDEGGDEKPST